jgi:hypothetical protein
MEAPLASKASGENDMSIAPMDSKKSQFHEHYQKIFGHKQTELKENEILNLKDFSVLTVE